MRLSGTRAEQKHCHEICLKEMCFLAVRKHFAVLGVEAVGDLPVPLVKELLPHLTICQLNDFQPALNQRGISTYSQWIGILLDMCNADEVSDLHTEEEAKHKVIRTLFSFVFYGFRNHFVTKNISSSETPSFLWAAAKYITQFSLIASSPEPLKRLTTDLRPLLELLERHIKSIVLSQCTDISKRKCQTSLYLLHRLLDHGVAKDLVVNGQCPIVLSWLLHCRGSQYVNPKLMKMTHSKQEDYTTSQAASDCSGGTSCRQDLDANMSEDPNNQATPCKRSKLDSVSMEDEESEQKNVTVDPQVLCHMFAPCDGPSTGNCPWGQINSLEIRKCGSDTLRMLNFALPTFFSLRSLTLHSILTFSGCDVLGLASALKQLSKSTQSSLTDLNISILPYTDLVEILLDASPSLTSLHVEIQTLTRAPSFVLCHTTPSQLSELPLEKLTVKIADLETHLHFITSVLRRCPHLSSFSTAGLRLPLGFSQTQLLRTISASNSCLKSLSFEDIDLSDCLLEILNLLKDCKLEELRFNDCRLLEKCSDKEKSLQQLVTAVKTVPSLHTLSLAQNRLAKNVCVLADLFAKHSPSLVRRLDISSNFIQPSELLEFAKRFTARCPPHRLTLDLRKNPGDRDPDTWNTAMKRLSPFCVLLVEGWISTNAMADHISNM
ncbi:uncharacterized protein V6R79_017225 [Siganus canaliculatus]